MRTAITALALALLATGPAFAAVSAGSIISVYGEAEATRESGETATLKLKSPMKIWFSTINLFRKWPGSITIQQSVRSSMGKSTELVRQLLGFEPG